MGVARRGTGSGTRGRGVSWAAVARTVGALALVVPPASTGAAEDAALAVVSAAPRSLDPEWLDAVRLEYAGQIREAGRGYEGILALQPGHSEAAWRAARSFWRLWDEEYRGGL